MMMSSPASLNPRHSRRFACDRCRAYKLRCQRDEQPGEPCERCSRASLRCTTTFNYAAQRPSTSAATAAAAAGHHQPITNNRTNGNNSNTLEGEADSNTRNDCTAARDPRLPSQPEQQQPSPPEERARNATICFDPHLFQQQQHQQQRRDSPPAPPPQRQQETGEGPSQRESNQTLISPALGEMPRTETTLSRPVSDGMGRHGAADTGDLMLLDQHSLGLDGLDFSMSDIPFDANDLTLLIGSNQSPSRADSGGRRAGGEDRGSRVFGPDDHLSFSGNTTDIFSWPGLTHNGSGGVANGSAESGQDRNLEAPDIQNSNGEPQPPQSHETPRGSYNELMKLSLELMEDQERLNAVAPLHQKLHFPLQCPPSQQFQYINRVLKQAARFWEIVKSMSETQRPRSGGGAGSGGTDGNNTNGTNGRVWAPRRTSDSNGFLGRDGDMDGYGPGSRMSSARRAPDHLLVVNLVMTYVYLVRSCRAVFARLLDALEMTPAAESLSLLRLPTLQYGEFQLENNLAIQVKVLIELLSGMLLRIGNMLGISPAGVVVSSWSSSGSGSSPAGSGGEESDTRLPFMCDAAAVSVREIILAQERAQEKSRGGVLPDEPLSLLNIINNLKRLLERRYSIF